MAHQHAVEITTRIPTLEEVGESLGMSKTRQQSIIQIVQKPKPEVRFRVAAKRPGSSKIRKKSIGKSLNLRKKSKSASTQD